MSPTRNSYKSSIAMLFKLKQTGRLVIGTGGVITSPKLPADNLELLEDIDSLQNDKTEVKIRIETSTDELTTSKKTYVATVLGYSSRPSGRQEMEDLKTRITEQQPYASTLGVHNSNEDLAKNTSDNNAQNVAYEEENKKKSEEDAKKKALEDKAKRKSEEEAKKRADAEAKKKSEEAALKRKAEQHSTFNQKGPVAKKRLVYPEETISILDEASSQNDMFAVDSSGDESDEDDEENEEEESSMETNMNEAQGQNLNDNEDESVMHNAPSVSVPVPHDRSKSSSRQSQASSSSLVSLQSSSNSVVVNNRTSPSHQQIIAALKARIEQLEQENDYLHHQIDDSEVLTKSLKSEIVELKNKQPENLIDKLQAAISLVDGIRNNETDAAGAVAAASSRRSSKPNNMGHSLRINTSDLKFAITIGRLFNGNLNAMVNKIMESVYTRIYMSEHSLSGLPPRVSKAQKDTVA
ncbi:hypothetical protein OUZ56_021511 [Daphnia magna]|uniref:Uncharacterized protein n=2 Tax=Daphnia magna TaxID=35525 RepID=A0ABQ9ZHL8_9CRUS|nr:hypothetical protein OUZ56_021511 [Daphnia magna]